MAAVRLAFEMDSPSRLRWVVASFDTGGTEYHRILQECESKKWRAFQTSVVGNKRGGTADTGDKAVKKKRKGKGDRKENEHLSVADKAKNKALFDTCVKGIPKDGDKPVCFHNLSAAGCQVKACRLSHKLVDKASLTEAVNKALTSLYGVLRDDLP